MANSRSTGARQFLLAGLTLVGAAFASSEASAQYGNGNRGYVGNSFLQIPDLRGDWRGEDYRGSVRVEAHYWQLAPRPGAQASAAGQTSAAAQSAQRAAQGQANAGQAAQAASQGLRAGQASGQGQAQRSGYSRRAVATIPPAPRDGEGTLVLSFDKENPVLPALMERCARGATMPEVTYSVSTQRSRMYPQIGPLPAGMPEYFDYRLRDVQFVDCPVVDGAPQQAIVVHFGDIDWLNWQSEANSMPVTFEPAVLQPLPRNLSGETRAWVLTWFAPAHDVSEDQCPVMNARPSEADYYALVPPEEAERERAALAGQGGPNFQNGQMSFRGPHRLDVTMLPGIVADPGQAEPQTTVARGVNLDGANGRRGLRNYVSPDGGLSGIDNQLYAVQGCVAGYQGHNGFIQQFNNNQMRDGEYSMLIEVAGIDNERNDNEVYVTWLYSTDAMAKSASGAEVLSDFTFHMTDNPEYTHYFSRVRARIVNGFIVTDQMQNFRLNLGQYGREAELSDARMRLQVQADGQLRGVIGGYRDWNELAGNGVPSSGVEFYHGYQAPAVYNSLRRHADGLRDPATGEYTAISAAFDIEGVPAFLVRPEANVASITPQSTGGSTP